jgi:predicted DNA-binding ribbon-helix-helix protein
MKVVKLKRSVIIAGRKTCVSLEDAFWIELKNIGCYYNRTLSDLVGEIAGRPHQGNLSSAIRVFVLEQFRAQAPSALAPTAASAAMSGIDRDGISTLSRIQP